MAYGYVDPDQDGMSIGAKIAIGLAALVGLPLILAFAYGIYVAFVMTPDQKFERMLAAEPEARIYVEPLKKHFPEEFADLRDSLISGLQGTDKEMAGRMATLGFMNDFVARHSYEAALAPDDQLAVLLDAQVKSFEVFQRSPKACFAMLRQVPPKDDTMSKADKVVMIGFAGKFVEAAAAGRDRPAPREALRQTDQIAVQRFLMADKISPDELDKMGSPVTGQADAERRCHVVYRLYKNILAMPRPQALRIFATVLRGQASAR